MNEYIKKHKVTLLMLLIVMLLVSCLIIPAYAYDLGGGLYCGVNLFNPSKLTNATLFDTDTYLVKSSMIKLFDLIPEKTYTLSYKDKLVNASNPFIRFETLDVNGKRTSYPFVTTSSFVSRAITFKNVKALYITFGYQGSIYMKDIMLNEGNTALIFEPYFQNYSGTVFPLNVVNKNNQYSALIGYYALPRPIPSNINVSFFVEGIDKFSFNEEEYPRFNIGFTRTTSLSYIFSNDFICDDDFYTEISLPSLTSYVINYQLINDYECFDMTYIVLDFMSGDTSDIARVQRAVIDGDIKGYIRVNSMNADYQGAYSEGYGAGIKDGYDIKQSDSLAIFPSFFGAIADFFKKFSSIEIFGITLGTVVATVVIIGVTISLYKMFR